MMRLKWAIAAVISLLLVTVVLMEWRGVVERSPRIEFGALATDAGGPEGIAAENRASQADGGALCAGGSRSYLCAARNPSGETEWRLGGGGRIERLQGGSEAVADFELDRSWHYLAVVTAAEGHPFLAVYDFRRWRTSGKRPEPLLAVNPYPGTLQLGGWSNNVQSQASKGEAYCLYFSSDGSLSGEAGDFPLPHPERFRACLPDARIEPM